VESGRWQILQVSGGMDEDEEAGRVRFVCVLLDPPLLFGQETEGRTMERYLSLIEGPTGEGSGGDRVAGVELQSIRGCFEQGGEAPVELDVTSLGGMNRTRFLLMPAPKILWSSRGR